MTKKTTKRALIVSMLSMFLCFTMMLGTTYAWFTDSVTSSGNIIKTGTLDVTLEYSDKLLGADSTEWLDASKGEIFKYENWEPGYTQIRYIKIENEGTLSFKWRIDIIPELTAAGVNLADVIDVYMVKDPTVAVTRDNLGSKVGNLTYLMQDPDGAARGQLKKGEYIIVAIALKMQETAGNEYQGQSVGGSFKIQLNATQLSDESDDLGNDYDNGAFLPVVYTAAELTSALEQGKDVKLGSDITINEPIVIPATPATLSVGNATVPAQVIDLNGKTINVGYAEGSTTNHIYAFTNNGNIVITGNGTINARGIFNYGSITLENGTINAIDGNGGYAIRNYSGATLTMNGGTIATTLEDDNKVDKGGYDATTVRVDDGATFVMNGGVINNICDYTFAIDNYGATTINGGNITSVHSTVSSYGDLTINGGKFVCDGLEGVTAHTVVAWSGSTTTINGGTFDGKDNYNGFAVDTAENAVVNVYGGNFLPVHSGSFYGNGTIKVYGGTYSDDVNAHTADGYKAVETPDGWMVIGSDYNYVANGVLVSTDGKTYFISNVAGYSWMDAQADDFFLNKTVKFTADIDFGGATLNSVRFWNGKAVVDGQGHTLSNFVIENTSGNAGLFNGTLKVQNLVVDNATVTGKYVGVIAGNMYGDVDNCTVKNSVINGTYWQTGAIAGQYNSGNVTNCVVENCTINGKSAVGALIGILNETAGERKVENCTVKNCTINQTDSFGGNYDNYFGVAVGLINVANSTVYFNNCTFENNTLKNVASNVIYGETESSTKVIVNGATAVHNKAELQAALDNGVANIVFGADIKGDVTVNQNINENLVIDGGKHEFDGTINIKAQSETNASGSIVIKNVNFKTADSSRTFIQSTETNHYPLNVTVSGCSFEGSGANSDVVGIAVKSSKNFVIENCTATKVHSLLQNTSGWDLTIKDVTVTESGRGMSLGTVQGVTLTNVTIKAVAKYGVRLEAGYNNNAVFTNCDIEAFIPVVVRKVSVDSSMTFNGTNKMEATNTDNIWCAIGTSEYEVNGSLPTTANKVVTVTINGTIDSTDTVCNNSGK